MLNVLFVYLIAINGPIPGIDSTSDYLVYYGNWNPDKVFRAKDFDLVILEPSNISSQNVAEIRAGHDGITGTDDDVLVIGYLSIGEDAVGTHTGDGRGPCYYDWSGDSIVYTHNGYASWYLDDADHNGLPDQNGTWGSYYVNAGDTLWWNFVEAEADAIFAKGIDGLFLDTIDTASPCSWGIPYCWTKDGMSQLIQHLRNLYPNKILIANRGLFYFDPNLPNYYAVTIRPYINGVMFEDYYLEWDWNTGTSHVSPWFGQNRTYWAPRVNTEAHKPDGFTVFALDYLSLNQPDHDSLLTSQIYYTIQEQGWVDYVTHIYLNVIRYDVFHHHPDGDRNPPTWETTIGLQQVTPGDTFVTLYWNNAIDQTPPVRYNIYYSTQSFNDPSQATLIPAITPDSGTSTDWQYVVTGLDTSNTYYFLVRAVDSASPPHEDHNMVILSTETGGGAQGIIIDGNFSDWAGVPQLDVPPQPVENQGDAQYLNADLVDLWYTQDDSFFYFSYSTAAPFSLSSFFYHVFLDADVNQSTGYHLGAIGADYLVENYGFYRYTGNGNNWNWTPISGFDAMYVWNRVEMAIPLDTLSPSGPILLTLNVNNGTPPYDSIDFAPDQWQNVSYVCSLNVYVHEKTLFNTPDLYLFWNSSDNLVLSVLHPGLYSLSLFDSSGRLKKILFKRYLAEGKYNIHLPRVLPSGIYFATLMRGHEKLKTLKVLHLSSTRRKY